ncbi:hypothetical protein BECAL_00097 [Bellilinea caldifistulae]|uniref:Glycosyltransferase RgtA/B/C/D-like domain-containing protein n=1 Tax=Bellilinea caldifistulae TaxID=360411 RepID=A0A0P6XNC0_9CHLR|nr:hypothetical protein [Bellilinea caldifistulae]KPL76755.1 hypothetical protein AC812_05535 [Bellilinea caldifistulae]GAP08964.1 hypothetical protein BECAL_00097 [Bellilinea caldifistulae]
MQNLFREFSLKKLVALIFFTGLLWLGFTIVEDFGISWDEPIQLDIGISNYRYLKNADERLLELKDRHYGPLFEIFLVRMMDQSSPRLMYLSRHFWNFFTFLLGVIGFYLLLESMYPRRWLSLFGAALLVFSPRLFADAFYNSKDIPFLVAVIWAMAALFLYLSKPSLVRLLLVCFYSAAAIAIRLPGMFLLALTALMLVREALARRLPPRRAATHGLTYLLLTAVLVFLFYPVFWHDPLGEIPQAFEIMSYFPHFASVLYMGHFLSPQELPWHYLPVWIGITTPIPYLLLMLAGFARVIRQWLSRPSSLLADQQTPSLLAALWLGVPAGAVILRGSPMYDGWRQMFFIYPALLIFAVSGWEWLSSLLGRRLAHTRAGGLLNAALAVAIFVPSGLWMASHHPYQNLYFNRLAGPDMQTVKMRFDMDYWGLTYRRGLEAILEYDPRPVIRVHAANFPGEANAAILPADQARRLYFVPEIEQADYFITNYRWHPEDYPFPNEIFTLWWGNAKALSVFRLR